MSNIKFDIDEKVISFKINYFTPGIVYYFKDNGISQPTHPRVSSPAGFYHNNKTYIAWQTLDPYIIYFDHTTNTWSEPVKIGTNPLTDDDHGPPQILRDNTGYFHAFYGGHNSLIKHSRTMNIDDITAWEDRGDIITVIGSYCKVLEDSIGFFFIFLRHGSTTDGDGAWIRSIDGGDTWSSPNAFVDFGAGKSTGYGAIDYEAGPPDKVHYAWCIFDTPDRLNIYHCYYNLTDHHAYTVDGIDLGVQINEAEANANCLVYNSGVTQTNQPVVHVYSGIPYIIFQNDDGGWKHKFTKWNGVSWDAPVTITTTDNQFNSCDFIVHNATNIEAYLVTDGLAGRGGDIERWDWDGVTWSKVKTVLTEGGNWKALGNPQIIHNYHDKIKLIFAEHIAEDFTTQLKIFAYGKIGFVENE